jgi:cytochrome P450
MNTHSTTSTPPGPGDGPLGIRLIRRFAQDPLGYTEHLVREYSDLAAYRFGRSRVYLINNPDYIRQVLVTDAGKFHTWTRIRKTMGKTIGTLTTIDEQRQRLVQQAFDPPHVEKHRALIVEHTQQMLDQWEANTVTDISKAMNRLTLGIITRLLFDRDVNAESANVKEAAATVSEMTRLESSAMITVPDWVPTARNRRERIAMETLHNYIVNIVRERRASGEDRGDLLSMLTFGEDENGQQLSEQAIFDEAVTLFITGYEATGNTLSWMWHLLAHHPQVEQALFDALSSHPGDESTPGSAAALPYPRLVFREALRLYPPAYVISRQAAADVTIGGYTIPEGSIVVISTWALQRHPLHWENAATFNPERFHGEEKTIADAYFPFGDGTATSVRRRLALLEGETIVTTVARRFRLAPIPGQTITPAPLLTLRPTPGIKMLVRERG